MVDYAKLDKMYRDEGWGLVTDKVFGGSIRPSDVESSARSVAQYAHDLEAENARLKAEVERLSAGGAPKQATTPSVCDCERGHNGLGRAGRECDCQPSATDDGWQREAEAQAAALAERSGIDTMDDHGEFIADLSTTLIEFAEWTAALSALTPQDAGEAKAWEFDRYINGILMAEGVTIERQSTVDGAMRAAAKIASRGKNGEVPVLVLRQPTPPVGEPTEAEVEVPDGCLNVGHQVTKTRGYPFPGEVRSVFKTRAGLVRYVVEATGDDYAGMLHIFSPDQLATRQGRAGE